MLGRLPDTNVTIRIEDAARKPVGRPITIGPGGDCNIVLPALADWDQQLLQVLGDTLAGHRYLLRRSSLGDRCACGWTSHDVPWSEHAAEGLLPVMQSRGIVKADKVRADGPQVFVFPDGPLRVRKAQP
jgi:hypothetical protein